jgi:hypothetical protein
MEPIGLRFKKDKELMIVHKCLSCGKISNNRIAGDDFIDIILSLVVEDSKENLLTIKNIDEIQEVLFGKKC